MPWYSGRKVLELRFTFPSFLFYSIFPSSSILGFFSRIISAGQGRGGSECNAAYTYGDSGVFLLFLFFGLMGDGVRCGRERVGCWCCLYVWMDMGWGKGAGGRGDGFVGGGEGKGVMEMGGVEMGLVGALVLRLIFAVYGGFLCLEGRGGGGWVLCVCGMVLVVGLAFAMRAREGRGGVSKVSSPFHTYSSMHTAVLPSSLLAMRS